MSLDVSCIVNTIFNSNTFILSKRDSSIVWIIDPGDVDILITTLQIDNKQVGGVLITHAHFDHIYGLNKLLTFYPNLTVYIGQEDMDALYSSKMNMSRYHEEEDFIYNGKNVFPLQNGVHLTLFDGVRAEVISVPGHTPGCLAYKINNKLFTGDAYIPGHEVVTMLPRANKTLAIKNKQILISLSNESKLDLYPGHGDILCTK